MAVLRKLVIDPLLIKRWQSNDASAYAILKLRQIVQDKKNIKLLCHLDNGDSLVQQYQHIKEIALETGRQQDLAIDLISDIVEGSITGPPEYIPLNAASTVDTIFDAFEASTFSDIEKILIRLAIQVQDLQILLAEPEENSDGLYNKNVRNKVCGFLGRQAILYASDFICPEPRIHTEGKTDWMHLEFALQKLKMSGQFLDMQIEFEEYSGQRGDKDLKKLCQGGSKGDKQVLIFIFDRDVPDTLKEIMDTNNFGGFRFWGNRRYSFALPVPEGREDVADSICIEFFYSDDELGREDENGRRIFLSTEFTEKGWHANGVFHTDFSMSAERRNKNRNIFIIDGGVSSPDGSVALSKTAFAKNVVNEKENFNNFDFSKFAEIFRVINAIITDSLQRSNLPS